MTERSRITDGAGHRLNIDVDTSHGTRAGNVGGCAAASRDPLGAGAPQQRNHAKRRSVLGEVRESVAPEDYHIHILCIEQ